ncbi:hypothetical protein ACOBV9_20850 (plasmid) [Pseudoalteromonas espejiana]
MALKINRALTEAGTKNYQYYLSDAGDVLVYERFADADSSHEHIENWDDHAGALDSNRSTNTHGAFRRLT